jgi:hypothetical protein
MDYLDDYDSEEDDTPRMVLPKKSETAPRARKIQAPVVPRKITQHPHFMLQRSGAARSANVERPSSPPLCVAVPNEEDIDRYLAESVDETTESVAPSFYKVQEEIQPVAEEMYVSQASITPGVRWDPSKRPAQKTEKSQKKAQDLKVEELIKSNPGISEAFLRGVCDTKNQESERVKVCYNVLQKSIIFFAKLDLDLLLFNSLTKIVWKRSKLNGKPTRETVMRYFAKSLRSAFHHPTTLSSLPSSWLKIVRILLLPNPLACLSLCSETSNVGSKIRRNLCSII